MVDQKGLPARAADAIGRYVRDDVEPKFQGRPEEVSYLLNALVPDSCPDWCPNIEWWVEKARSLPDAVL